ncbi:MAG: acyltransferase family protein [Acidimicrobiales bacterium]
MTTDAAAASDGPLAEDDPTEGSTPRSEKIDFKMRALPALDGTRGIGALVVVLYHMTGHNQIWQMWGYGLVVLFMTMSGFLLTSLWLQHRYEADHHPARTFVRRRVFRVVPTNTVYSVTFGILLLAVLLLPAPDAGTDDSGGALDQGEQVEIVGGGEGEGCTETDATPVVAAATNLVFILNFFQADGMCGSVFSHLWTVNIEFQFYLLLPLFMLGLWRIAKRDPVKVGLIVTGVGSLLVWGNRLRLDYSQDSAFQMAYFRTDMRFDAIFVGIFAALALYRWGLPRRAGPWGVAAAVLFFLGGIGRSSMFQAGLFDWVGMDGIDLDLELEFWLQWQAFPVAISGACFVIWVAARPPGAKTHILEQRWALWLGAISYSLYVIHLPFAGPSWLIAENEGLHNWHRAVAVILGTAAAIVAAWLLHIFLEKPFMRRGAGKDWDVPIVSPWLKKRREAKAAVREAFHAVVEAAPDAPGP